MAERVIFEFGAEGDEGCCGFGFKHGEGSFRVFGPSIRAWCHDMGVPGRHSAGRTKRSYRKKDEPRRHMRETLDFLERLYQDLYGGEEPDERGDPEP